MRVSEQLNKSPAPLKFVCSVYHSSLELHHVGKTWSEHTPLRRQYIYLIRSSKVA